MNCTENRLKTGKCWGKGAFLNLWLAIWFTEILPFVYFVHKNKKDTEVHEKYEQGLGLTVNWLWLIGDFIIGNLICFPVLAICSSSCPRNAAEVSYLHFLSHLLFLFLVSNYEIRSRKMEKFAICHNHGKFFIVIWKSGWSCGVRTLGKISHDQDTYSSFITN